MSTIIPNGGFKTVAIFALLMFCFGVAEAEDVPDSTISGLNMAVPDAPAFILLDVSEDKIMRPTSLQDLAATVNPKEGFALEFAPIRLLNGKSLTYKRFRDNRFWNTIRISAGLVRGEDNVFEKASLGVRVNIIDKADYRFQPEFADLLNGYLNDINTIELATGPDGELTAEQKLAMDSINTRIQNDMDSAMSAQWTKPIVQLAYAGGVISRDSAGGDVGLYKHAAWLSAALPIGGKGQFLLGANGEAVRDSATAPWIGEATAAFRLYYGTNRYKVYGEGQGTFAEKHRPVWLGLFGIEFGLMKGLWLDANVGFQDGGDFEKVRMVTDYSVKYAVNIGD